MGDLVWDGPPPVRPGRTLSGQVWERLRPPESAGRAWPVDAALDGDAAVTREYLAALLRALDDYLGAMQFGDEGRIGETARALLACRKAADRYGAVRALVERPDPRLPDSAHAGGPPPETPHGAGGETRHVARFRRLDK